MKTYTALGIDPGLANTGLAIVRLENGRYQLVEGRLVKTTPDMPETERLLKIMQHTRGILNAHEIDIAAIERVYHNQNVSSSISTGKAIGAAMVGIATHAKTVLHLTPQQVKRATGLPVKEVDKHTVKRMARGIFKTQFTSHHIADAALCALAGILKFKSAETHD